MKISFFTFGCTVNDSETQKMKELFANNGDEIIDSGQADVIIINSCAITSSADKNATQLLSRLRKNNPGAILALVGCYGEMLAKNNKTTKLDADIILGNNKLNIVDEVNKLKQNKKTIIAINNVNPTNHGIRAFLEIQNGCSNFCSYCIVPYLRGKPVSKPYDEVKTELQALALQGYKEIVISGMNLALYKDLDKSLIDVLEAANTTSGIESVRLSSLEPIIFTDEFIEKLPQLTKLVPHFHISLQSGCDKTLTAMNRRYSFADYFSVIKKLQSKIKDVAITTDIIVGFPGESENDFLNSCNNIVKCNLSDIHIFKYSKREGTAAAKMEDQVSEHKKNNRATLLQGIKMQAKSAYISRFINTTQRVTILKNNSLGFFEGVTAHNISVMLNSDTARINEIYDIYITAVSDNGDYLTGNIID